MLSGPGFVNLYVALAELAGRGHPTVTPEDVTNLAKQGEPLARKTLGDVLRDARHRRGRPRGDDGRARRHLHRRRHRAAARRAARASRSFALASRTKAAIASISRRSRRTSSRHRCRRFAGCVTCSAIASARRVASARRPRSGGAARRLARRRSAGRLARDRSCSSTDRTRSAAPARRGSSTGSAGSEPPQPASANAIADHNASFQVHGRALPAAARSAQSSTRA